MKVDFQRACSILRDGHALVFPTDTVVGIGVAVAYADGFDEVFAAKRRPAGKPLAWLVDDVGALDRWGAGVPGYARVLAEAFWPGAVTLVVPQGKGTTLGLRMPASSLALDLIKAVGSPLATTSANFSGQPAPATLGDLDPDFVRDLPVLAVSFDLPAPSAVASTVIDCTGSSPRVLRAGTITASDIEEVLAHAD